MSTILPKNVCALQPGATYNNLGDMVGGWFVGAFEPVSHFTKDVEVAVKHFSAGYRGRAHHHKIATEVTLLLSGCARMAGYELRAGDIVTLIPGISSVFEALEDCVTVVVKHPGMLDDKFYDDEVF